MTPGCTCAPPRSTSAACSPSDSPTPTAPGHWPAPDQPGQQTWTDPAAGATMSNGGQADLGVQLLGCDLTAASTANCWRACPPLFSRLLDVLAAAVDVPPVGHGQPRHE